MDWLHILLYIVGYFMALKAAREISKDNKRKMVPGDWLMVIFWPIGFAIVITISRIIIFVHWLERKMSEETKPVNKNTTFDL